MPKTAFFSHLQVASRRVISPAVLRLGRGADRIPKAVLTALLLAAKALARLKRAKARSPRSATSDTSAKSAGLKPYGKAI